MLLLHDRVKARIQKQLCPICINAVAEGSCSVLNEGKDCPLLLHLDRIIDAVTAVSSDEMQPYIDRLRKIVCSNCLNNDRGACHERDALNCTLDIYFPLVVSIIEEELAVQAQTS